MPPDDPTPLGDAMTHRFPEQKIPQPKPAAGSGPRDSVDEWHDEAGFHGKDESPEAATESHALSSTMTGRPRLPDASPAGRDEEAVE